jgi:hypothetical protein
MNEGQFLDWIEIMSGHEMSDWIRSNDNSLWIEMNKDLFWLHPKLYMWWKLRYR